MDITSPIPSAKIIGDTGHVDVHEQIRVFLTEVAEDPLLTPAEADGLYAPLSVESDIATLENEINLARGGEASLDARLDLLLSSSALAATLLTTMRTTDCVLRWDGTGSQPLRATVTSDTLRPVVWRQLTEPPTTAGYAIEGLDIWDRTPE